MIKVVIGNIFESEAQTLVNTVNCVGVMGKGIALEFKKRFPEMFKDYRSRCNKGEVELGKPYIYKSVVPPWILNFPTKDHWRSFAKVNDIESGLQYLLKHYREWGITSIAVPPLGTGLGQLEWRIIGPLLYRYLSNMNIDVYMYAPFETPQDELTISFLKGGKRMTQLPLKAPDANRIKSPWVALVEILKRVEDHPYHPPVGRTIFQKMAYTANVEGLPLGLRFEKRDYGPYATDLKKKLTQLQNNGLIIEKRNGPMFEVLIGPTFKDARLAYAYEISQWEVIIEKVSDLFIRVNTRMSEIIASVIFSAQALKKESGKIPTEQDVVNYVASWKRSVGRNINEAEIASTVRNLAALHWLDVKSSPGLELPKEDALIS